MLSFIIPIVLRLPVVTQLILGFHEILVNLYFSTFVNYCTNQIDLLTMTHFSKINFSFYTKKTARVQLKECCSKMIHYNV